jgi:hypothetical protein
MAPSVLPPNPVPEESTFYVQLGVENLRTDIDTQTCVHKSFFDWLRKLFKSDDATISLAAKITLPDSTTLQVPLFQISKNEKSSPPACLTQVLTGKAITPLYVARRGDTFLLDVQARTRKDTALTPTATTISAATTLLTISANSSAWLLKMDGPSQTALSTAKDQIDSSLSNNWSYDNQSDYQFALGAWPGSGDWSDYKDTAQSAN